MQRVVRSGWYGDSHGHSLAARGVTFKKKEKVDPLYFARASESKTPFSKIREMVVEGMTLKEMSRHSDESPEEIRRKAIVAIEMRDADGTLSMLDRMGVDEAKKMMSVSPGFKKKATNVLESSQQRSMLGEEKGRMLGQEVGVKC